MAQAYHVTHGVKVIVTRASNNFGPHQHPEKLIPLCVTNAIDGHPLPIYGDGQQQRDWLFVEDHCEALGILVERGSPGEVYNIGVGAERPNLEVVLKIMKLMSTPEEALRHVPDRAGHDRRYALDCSRMRSLDWEPRHDFADALAGTVRWYESNPEWWRPIKEGEFEAYYTRQYGARLQEVSE